MTPRTGEQPCRETATYTGQQKQKKRGQVSMPRVGFEPTIPVFEQTKTFRVLDRAATVVSVGYPRFLIRQILRYSSCLENHVRDHLLQLIICVSFLIKAYLKYFAVHQ
jgi:hypothetical protein